ncbi:MAG: hypothetical protein Q8O40_07990 [Chloroflexota bacterium]|nr:hypothetical protein [Chloroflexota bacterium]
MAISLRDQVVRVQGLRVSLETIKGTLKEARANFDKANADLITGLDARTAELAQAEAVLRAEALDVFNSTQQRKPCPGVEVKDYMEIDYLKDKALAWALEHKMALVLDAKAFESLAKAAKPPLGFVAIGKVSKATIATDLGKALNEVADVH